VDDDPDIARFVVLSLEANGFDTATAADGQETLEHLDAVAPDVIVTGVIMPRMDGLELVTRIREEPAHATLPLLLLTARSRMIDKQEGLSLGADDYLVKPFDPAELIPHTRALADHGRPKDRDFADPSNVTPEEAARYLAARCVAADCPFAVRED
jgi:DNA-binding response OmpR family regulator